MPALWDDGVEAIDVAPVHWGASTILTIFFAACLVSALFFGLGYSFGMHGPDRSGMARLGTGWLGAVQSQSGGSSAGARPIRSVTGPGPSMKRSARSSSGLRLSHVASSTPAAPKPVIAESDARPSMHPELRSVSVLTPVVPVVSRRQPTRPMESTARLQTATGQRHVMVQIAAVRSRGNARTLVSQLRKRGFDARIYAGRHDPYLHVGIGPFSSVSEAQAMRRRVRSSGYRAVLK